MVRISVIIATYNRGKSLVRTLESLAGQTMDPAGWEAVVVNNNSRDDTEELFGDFISRHPDLNIRMVREEKQGLSHARNRGIMESRGALIAILDDDELVNREFVEAYSDFFDSRPDVVVAGGRMTPLYEFAVPKWLSPITEMPIAGTLDMGDVAVPLGKRRYPTGGNMAIRSSALQKYGMFDPELGRTGTKLLAGEEKDLFNRLREGGEQIWYVPRAEILHIIPEGRLTRSYFNKATRMVGVSERVRTKNISGTAYFRRLTDEAIKWGATVVLGLWYVIKLQPQKAGYLFLLRRNITQGLLCGEKK